MDRSDVNIKFLLPILCFFCSLYGVYYFVGNQEKNMCEMTYMFEHPQYLQVPLKFDVAQRFPRYKLYIYGEGKYFQELAEEKYLGIPVLFIPGNAGSHKQVRSLASVALRMGHSLHSMIFNFFAVDFDEEISAIYGGTLNDQTEFVLACVKHIKSLYSSEKKVILIGHSMGGVIAKAAFSLPKMTSSNVSLILTLASPHKEPVVSFDSMLVNFYAVIRETWKYRMKEELRDIPIISIGGGQRDILVRSDLTDYKFQHKCPMDVHVLTPSIPGVWLSTDHLAIAWCKQLILTICRSLYDLHDKHTKQISSSETDVQSILKHHYISRSFGNHYPQVPLVPVSTFPNSGQWIEQENNAWRFSRSKVLSSIYLLIPVVKGESIVIVATGIVKRDWIYGCTKLSKTEEKTCIQGENLSDLGEIIPSRGRKNERRMINLSAHQLNNKEYSYVLIYITPLNSQVEVLGERYDNDQRTKLLDLPSLLTRLFMTSPMRLLSVSLPEQSVFYNITVSQAYGVFQSVEFQLETRLCRAGSVVGQGFIKTHIPYSNEDSYHHIRTVLGGLTTIPLQAHILPPPNSDHDVNLQLILDPECSVVLTVKFPLYVVASQFVKFYGVHIVGYSVSVLLALLAGQLYLFESYGFFPSFYKVFGYYPTYISLVAIPSVLFYFLLYPGNKFSPLPSADNATLDDESFLSLLLLRTLLYLIASGFIIALYTVMSILLKGISKFWLWIRRSTILNVTQVPLEQTLRGPVQISKPMLVWCALIGSVSIGFSSSVGSVMVALTYLFKLISLHSRCKAEEERRGSGVITTCWYMHFSLVLLWMFVLALVFPGLIAWTKSLKFTLQVPNDPYTPSCILLLLSCALLWQLPTLSFNRFGYKKASWAIHIVAILSALYGLHSVYRLLYAICFSMVVVSIQQIYAHLNRPFVKQD